MTEMKPLRCAQFAVALVGAAVSMTVLLAVDARAARYDVHACRVPDGTAVPANGWRMTAPTLGGGAQASIDCPGKGMSSRPTQTSYEDGTLLGFEFSAPPGTTIAGWKRVIEGDMKTLSGGPPPYWWEIGGFGDRANGGGRFPVMTECGNCGIFQADWDVPTVPEPLSRLFMAMRCDTNATPCQGNGSYFTLRSIAVHLEDARPPQIVGASGDLLEATASKPGLHYLSLGLRDVGSGLYKARIEADGHLVSERSVDENGGACREPFIQSVPCKLAANVDLPVDTTRLTPGHHTVTVRVFDATGVNSAVYGPINVDVDDPTKLRCPPEADGLLTRRVRRAFVRFGETTWLTGRARGAAAARGSRVRLLGRQTVGASLQKGGRFRLR